MPPPVKLVNRGPAGLLSKLPKGVKPVALHAQESANGHANAEEHNKIAPALREAGLVVPLDSLVPDPENARLHPERNMEAIKASLRKYGQVKPVVVRTATRVVVAGNGTMAGAKALGWTEIAATFVDMNEVDAAGYGLADNRTAELAKWDFEVVARLDKLLEMAGEDPVGWSCDELTILRTDPSQFQQDGILGGGEPEDIQAEETEEKEHDAEVLKRLKVTIDEPQTQVARGQVYKLGKHTLAVLDVQKDYRLWQSLLDGSHSRFCPYPGPIILLTIAGEKESLLLVQPDCFIAGHIIDHYISAHGKKGVSRAEDLIAAK